MWELIKVANGRKSCDNSDLAAGDVFSVVSVIEKNCKVSYNNQWGLDPNAAAFDLRIEGKHVTIGWDIWSGVFIMSEEPSGDIVIERIYEILANLDNEKVSRKE